MDKVRILRVIEYVGDRDAVESIVSRSIHGERSYNSGQGDVTIRVATVGIYPEILKMETPDA